MKKSYLYIAMLILFAMAAGFIVVKQKTKSVSFYPLLNRKNIVAQTEEWEKAKKNFDGLMKMIATNPDDSTSRIALSTLYIQEARVTGNYMYYDQAAMKYVNEVLEKNPMNFQALSFKSLLYLSQHHFTDGLAFAEKAQKINPYNAFVYGLLVDGNVETGNYKTAIEYADKMVSIRPDIRSYSRISYLREIHGDYPGAIEAMKMATESGQPGDETTEWSRVQLGQLYEKTGDLKNAEMHYSIALQNRPSYAYALAGLGRLSLAAKDYNKAVHCFLQADSLVNDYSFKEELIDVYQLSDQKNKADSISTIVIDAMNKDAQNGKDNENIGHYADRELAYAYLKTNNYDKALEHALAEYNRRPDNIDVNETVAWVYYKKGDHKKALLYIQVALKTNSKNPTLLCRAGLIYAKTGDRMKAKTILQEALKNNPNIDEKLKTESMMLFQTL
jgi:tetratricopeptide (TPR) repeat protein